MVSVVLVDFGNTLADETFMRRDSHRFPSWAIDYGAVVGEVVDDWDTGRLSSRQLAERVATRLGASAEDVHDHMLELCRNLTWYPIINGALWRRRARGERQALVTVNPDLFATIAAHHALHDRFDAIVASWEHRTNSKVDLCNRALELLGGLPPAESILIDNVHEHVAAWRSCGGEGYLFRDDGTFSADVLANRVPGFLPADVVEAQR